MQTASSRSLTPPSNGHPLASANQAWFDIGAEGAAYISRAIDEEEKRIPDKLRNCTTPEARLLLQGEAIAYDALRTRIRTIYTDESQKLHEHRARYPER